MRRPQRKLPPLAALVRPLYSRLQLLDAAVGGFLALITAAMVFYPGGTWWEPQAKGHRFWENFLCDLLHRQALSKLPNLVASRLAEVAMLLLVAAIALAFSMATDLVPSRRVLGRRLGRVGMLSSVLLVAAPLLPSDRFPTLHAQATVILTLPVLFTFAALVGTLLLERESTALLRGTSLVLLVLLVLCLVLYAWDQYFSGPSLKLLPGLERVATLLLVVWLLAVSRFVRRRLMTALQKAQTLRAQSS